VNGATLTADRNGSALSNFQVGSTSLRRDSLAGSVGTQSYS
jgi:hypothetical protein